jgi:hypothetical protein
MMNYADLDRLLMKRRREHGECETREGGRGCLVFETKICEYRRQRMRKVEVFREWLANSRKGKEVLWWIVVGMVGVMLAGGLALASLIIGV